MTNEELIGKIRAEIEKLKTFYGELHTDFVCESLLSFLDTLEPEKPMKQEELEDEINLVWEKLEKDYSPSALDKTKIIVSGLVGEKQFSNIARHFAKWGAEHNGSSEASFDLDQAAEISFDEAYYLTGDYTNFLAKGLTENQSRPIGPHWFCEYAKKRFIDGAKWQENKEQETIKLAEDHAYLAGADWQRERMMKEAVEGKIIFLLNGDVAVNIGDTDKYNLGQKVRVIVLPKEDEK